MTLYNYISLMHFYCLPIIMLTLHILSLFIYTYFMCLYLCISDVPHGIRNKELELVFIIILFKLHSYPRSPII